MPTAFYRHFDSVESLGLALVDESFVSLRELLREVRTRAPEFADFIDESLVVLARARARPPGALLRSSPVSAGPGPSGSATRSGTRSS